MAIRFYNPGTRINAKLTFDHPTNDIRVQNTISYHPLDAEEGSFFDVPTEVNVTTDNGDVAVPVNFYKRVKLDYRSFGVVMIDPRAKQPIHEDDNVALTEKEAKEKGERLWRQCLLQHVREHERICIEARHNGLKPKPAFGNVKHALKVLGVEDPAEDIADVLARKQDTSEVATLKQTVANLQTQMNQLLAKAAK